MSKPKSYWNYRILTRVVKANKLTVAEKNWREFFISEVYYKKGKPISYAPDLNPLSGWDELKDLKWTIKHLKEALKHPVLDIDNFPQRWKNQ